MEGSRRERRGGMIWANVILLSRAQVASGLSCRPPWSAATGRRFRILGPSQNPKAVTSHRTPRSKELCLAACAEGLDQAALGGADWVIAQARERRPARG